MIITIKKWRGIRLRLSKQMGLLATAQDLILLLTSPQGRNNCRKIKICADQLAHSHHTRPRSHSVRVSVSHSSMISLLLMMEKSKEITVNYRCSKGWRYTLSCLFRPVFLQRKQPLKDRNPGNCQQAWTLKRMTRLVPQHLTITHQCTCPNSVA